MNGTHPTVFDSDESCMRRALAVARRGLGAVEPNPCVGAVIVDDRRQLIAEGWHGSFGGPHAEAVAIEKAGDRARGATLFVTLEPCAHFGKTPPCADAVIRAGIRRVVVAVADPAAHTSGKGLQKLRDAGVTVEVGLCEAEGRRLIAPFAMLQTQGRPWVHAKWAMTLDGRIASRTGHSQWISGERSRKLVHELRGRMDAVVVGIGTALADDPLLTPRPPGPRTPTRIVLDRHLRLSEQYQLTRSLDSGPVCVATRPDADAERMRRLRELGIEVLPLLPTDDNGTSNLRPFLQELGRRQMTNILIEGGSRVLGAFWDQQVIDEVHAFIAPKLLGGAKALSPLGGTGLERIPDRPSLTAIEIETLDGDLYLHGLVDRE